MRRERSLSTILTIFLTLEQSSFRNRRMCGWFSGRWADHSQQWDLLWAVGIEWHFLLAISFEIIMDVTFSGNLHSSCGQTRLSRLLCVCVFYRRIQWLPNIRNRVKHAEAWEKQKRLRQNKHLIHTILKATQISMLFLSSLCSQETKKNGTMWSSHLSELSGCCFAINLVDRSTSVSVLNS